MGKPVEITGIIRSRSEEIHKKISHVTGYLQGKKLKFKFTQHQAIDCIEKNIYDFYIVKNGRRIDVIVETSPTGKKYLKSVLDDFQPHDLLSLPENN